ncbi:hypothetical protein [Bacillus sp. Marseille-P3800]|uniref:hypothetical protein n=1 Tax=Bacillus sp. Marseille-P3800 TaxID=2014782 RepID=UPI000C089AB5|nr:hypothetical protein [Bacillus sp. Marseille-P3800]
MKTDKRRVKEMSDLVKAEIRDLKAYQKDVSKLLNTKHPHDRLTFEAREGLRKTVQDVELEMNILIKLNHRFEKIVESVH